jgi:hypothetical protein
MTSVCKVSILRRPLLSPLVKGWRRRARDLRGPVEFAEAGVRHDEGAVSCGGALVYGSVHGGDGRVGDCVWAGG